MWVVCWVALFGVMHTPRERLPEVHVSNLDKAAHITGYLLLGLLGGAAARRNGVVIRGAWYARWFAIYAAYAAFDELTQPMFHRSADVLDWAADMIGVTVALGVVYIDASRGRRASDIR